MADPLGREPGGILSLASLLEEQSEAIEYDLIRLGLRLRNLGSDALTWRDLKVIVRCSPLDSALTRAKYPVEQQWQLSQQLLADMADSLRWLVWSKTTDAQHGRNRPDPIERPGVKSNKERIGSTASTEQLNSLLGWQ